MFTFQPPRDSGGSKTCLFRMLYRQTPTLDKCESDRKNTGKTRGKFSRCKALSSENWHSLFNSWLAFSGGRISPRRRGTCSSTAGEEKASGWSLVISDNYWLFFILRRIICIRHGLTSHVLLSAKVRRTSILLSGEIIIQCPVIAK
jgi:hypothetical protein